MQEAKRGSRRAGLSRDSAILAGVAVLGGIAASFANGAPTEVVLWDSILQGLLGLTVVLAASKAPRWPTIWAATIAAGASSITLWALAGWLALMIAIVAALLLRRNRLAGAVSAALAIQALLRLPPIGFFGLQSLLAAAAIVPLLVLGYSYGTRQARALARGVAVALVTAVLGILMMGGIALLNARTDVNQGISAARRGLDAARSGEVTQVADELDRAELLFNEAGDSIASPFARSLRFVPIASQHHQALETAVEQGAVVTSQAASTIREANIRELRLSAGSLDLDVLSDMAPQLRSTTGALADAVAEIRASRSPWLLPLIENRIDVLLDEVEELRPEIELGADAAEVVPSMLGAEQPKTYFVMFANPGESRELGGFLGSWALLTFEGGRLRLGESGRIQRLYDTAEQAVIDPDTATGWFLEMARPTQFPQNLTSSPDLQQVAAVSRQVLGGVSELPIDGFIYADGIALIDLLEISGPVDIPFQDAPLTNANAFEFFFEDQYRLEEFGRTDVFDELAVVADAVVSRLSTQTLPGPEQLGRIMGPAARAGHLQVVTFDDRTNDFLRSVKLLRDFERDGTTDFVGLVQTNGLANKMDIYLERELDYRVVDSGEGLAVTATATLRSTVPDDAPPFTLGSDDTVGINRVLLSLYTPHALTSATIDGLTVDHRTTNEFGLQRYLVEVIVPPNAADVVVEFALVGSALEGDPYSLEIWHQPLVNADGVSVAYTGPEGELTWEEILHENEVISANNGLD